ncbi:DUF4843 domain-containing protein [Sphingobacterium psychroaquaticum]|nr:DUF4843 domain-containing protein [Sphingobacterium psychroaquaticum]
MKRFAQTICILFALMSTFSCEKDKLIDYSGEPSIYFFETNRPLKFQGEILKDSTIIEFAATNLTDSIQPIVIATLSKPENVDRSYILKVDPKSTAIEGTHYEFVTKDFVISKNEIQDTVFIKWSKKPEMANTEFKLYLYIESNENFNTDMKDRVINPNTGEKISHIKYQIIAHDMIPKPVYWLDSFYGPFTRKKFLLMCEVFDMEPLYFINLMDISEMTALAKMMHRYLNEQKAAGNIIYEDNGTPMTMGSVGQQ